MTGSKWVRVPTTGNSQWIRVRTTKPGCFGTALGLFMVLLLVGAVIAYWYVFAPLAVVVLSVWLFVRRKRKRAAEEKLRHKPGPRDPWLDEVVVRLAEFEFTEFARNTGPDVAGVPIEGDVRLDAPRFSVVISLLASADLARQADFALRAKPEIRGAITQGRLLVRPEGRILYTADGHGGPVDEYRLNEVVQIVGGIAIGPPRPAGRALPAAPASSAVDRDAVSLGRPQASAADVPGSGSQNTSGDVLDQVQRLAMLRDSGVLTEAEFEEKKAELLRRL